MTQSADYLIVGAGTAGCVLASRLSEDPETRVTLLECGGVDSNPDIADTSLGALFRLWSASSPENWGYATVAQSGLG